ncbi:unnamed protein product, partial [marine sediment metagenome]
SRKPLRELMDLLTAIEEQASAVQRWGLSLQEFLALEREGKLPAFRVLVDHHQKFCYSEEEMLAFLAEEQKRQGKEVAIAGSDREEEAEKEEGLEAEVIELHGARELERAAKKLKTRGFQLSDCLPVKDGEKTKQPRFVLRAGDREMPADSLLSVLHAVRELGQKGMDIQRYKGLGEMNADQLWETTMDPAKRTLLRVKMEDATIADKMFTTLMGQEVEPRRKFIEKHALEVRFLDV